MDGGRGRKGLQCAASLDVQEDSAGGAVEVAAPETDAVVEA